MRASAALRSLALASLAVAASAGCKPAYTCLPGATCTQSFDIGDGVDKTSGLPFNYSTASGSVTGGSLGGRSFCGPAGCDDNALALTFQTQDLSVKWVSASCESRETPEQCRLATKTPIPTSPPLTTALTGFIAANVSLKRRPWVFEVRDLWPESAVASAWR